MKTYLYKNGDLTAGTKFETRGRNYIVCLFAHISIFASEPILFYIEKLINAKQIQQLERKWRHTSLQVHREMDKTQCAQVKSDIKEEKSDYYASEIEQSWSANRRLYHLLNGLLQRRKSPCLPANDNMHNLAASFSNFFCAKIDTIRVALRTQSTLTSTTITDQHPTPCGSQLHSFPTATTSDICNMLNNIANNIVRA